MSENKSEKINNIDEQEKIKAETAAQMIRSRVNDYIAIILALGTVFILWLLQLVGLY